MIGQYFNIPKYNWEVKVYYGVTKHDIPFCLKKLRKLTTQSKYAKECKETLYTNKKDRAYIYSSYRTQETVIFIGVHSSTGELINTITHEANHLKSHIATVYNLNEKDEEVCYIIGGIAEEMSNLFIPYICNKNLIF